MSAVNTTALPLAAAHVVEQLKSQSPAVLTALAAGAAVLLNLLYAAFSSSDKTRIPSLRGLPYQNAWLFFTKRYDFVTSGFSKLKTDVFKFNVLQHKVVVMRGENARKLFYNDKDLSFTDGYAILMGGAPQVKELKVDLEKQDNLSWFQRKITHMLRKERLTALLPDLFADLERRMNSWPQTGTMNPFENIYDLVFQLTARAATSNEIADHPEKIARIADLYWTIEKGSNPRAMVFPFLPNRGVQRKNAALAEVYGIISEIVDKRKASGGSGDGENPADAIQVLADSGDTTGDIVQFVLGTLFAGVINTGINACWILLFLAANEEWRHKAIEEINAFIERYAPAGAQENAGLTLAGRLAKVPPEAWEEGMPVMELVIREAIRLTVTGSTLRRNVKEDIVLDGMTVEKGAFMVHSLSSVHLNPEVYTDPEEFDPSRFEEGREEDKKTTYGFLGWGVGRHPCLGMRFAKLEIKIICALFLTSFEYSHVDAKGNPARVKASDVDRNDIFQARPRGAPPVLKYRRVKV